MAVYTFIISFRDLTCTKVQIIFFNKNQSFDKSFIYLFLNNLGVKFSTGQNRKQGSVRSMFVRKIMFLNKKIAKF